MKVCWRAVILVFALGCQALLPGCGGRGPLVPVRGQVTLAEKPLVGGILTFIPLEKQSGELRPDAEMDAEGNYSLKTGGREGAPVGKYRATLTISGKDQTQSAQFDPVYSQWEKSLLLVEIVDNAPPGAYDLKLLPR